MALPAPFKEIAGKDAHKATWNGCVCTVTMTDLVITQYKPKSHTRDRLFIFTNDYTGEKMYMTGTAYDKFVQISKDRIARGLLTLVKK